MKGVLLPRCSAHVATEAMFALACIAGLSGAARSAQYHAQDTRRDVFQAGAAQAALADSTVALFPADRVALRGGRAELTLESYGEELRLCKDEPFREQRTGADCSGALVGPDLVLTAGHCVETAKACARTKIVFGFSIRRPGEAPDSVPAGEVYGCARIVARRGLNSSGEDWALLRLDRVVDGHKPLVVDPADAPVGSPVFMIGHSAGLPAKIAGDASIQQDFGPAFFLTDLDSYAHNSGSPVFNARSGLIAGVLSFGSEEDLEDSVETGGADACRRSKRCTLERCGGEGVTKSSLFFGAVADASTPRPLTSLAIGSRARGGQALATLEELASGK